MIHVVTLISDGKFDGNIFTSISIHYQGRISGLGILTGTLLAVRKSLGKPGYGMLYIQVVFRGVELIFG